MTKVISIAVPKGGVGKSTTAVNLSASLAIAEKKTLLIDFDSTGSSTICLGFEHKDISGNIFDVLSFRRAISEVIYKTELTHLDLIPSKILPVDEERLHKITNNFQLFSHILHQEQFEIYDYIIIDGPPLLVSDAKTLASQVDGTIVVFNAAMTRRGAAQRALRELRNINNAEIVGTVLLGVRARKGGYFQEVYRSYHEYQQVQVTQTV